MCDILDREFIEEFTPGEYNSNFHRSILWLEYLFRENEIDMIHFLAWNEIIKTCRYVKINGLVLEGLTNAGKSLIIDNIIGPAQPEEIPRERDNSGFHLDQLPGAACALFEEPMITPTNVGTWKLLLEGKTVKTDIKNKDKEGIKRLPIYITTAIAVTNNIDSNETSQIQQRIKIFKFKKSIQHRKDEYTISHRIASKLIRRAPTLIKPIHFAYLLLKNYDEIIKKIKEEDQHHTINREHQKTTETICQRAKEWQTQRNWY